jgi:lipopolysaccharide transport system ATP-binding protein
MSTPVISVENLSKSYLIGHQGPREPYTSLRDTLAHGAKSVLRKTCDLAMGKQSLQGDSVEEFWALKDVSFEVQQGEVLGIIGRNGAGKSTLLKVLSRITEPTSGRVTLTGRVASLLEVGTGFHPELTGRENIFLNGAILGMSRREIKDKFDEIVDFAGVEKFLDTPVKRYSSGMYVRLAFAVAAHLEPEILIVDEVLAVGDAEFQKKCMGKMKDVAGEGRTVIFVSHNMGALATLCSRGVMLDRGSVVSDGAISRAFEFYYKTANSSNFAQFDFDPAQPSITSIKVDEEIKPHGDLNICISYKSPYPLKPPVAGIVVSSATGTPIFGSNCRISEGYSQELESSDGVLTLRIRNLPLRGGDYHLSAWLGDWNQDYDHKPDAVTICVSAEKESPKLPNLQQIGFVSTENIWIHE